MHILKSCRKEKRKYVEKREKKMRKEKKDEKRKQILLLGLGNWVTCKRVKRPRLTGIRYALCKARFCLTQRERIFSTTSSSTNETQSATRMYPYPQTAHNNILQPAWERHKWIRIHSSPPVAYSFFSPLLFIVAFFSFFLFVNGKQNGGHVVPRWVARRERGGLVEARVRGVGKEGKQENLTTFLPHAPTNTQNHERMFYTQMGDWRITEAD